jgi:hypothetical protein
MPAMPVPMTAMSNGAWPLAIRSLLPGTVMAAFGPQPLVTHAAGLSSSVDHEHSQTGHTNAVARWITRAIDHSRH